MNPPNEVCAYCDEPATTQDVVGLPTCASHATMADAYARRRFALPALGQNGSLAKTLEPDERKRLAIFIGSEHPYGCRCKICREWWKAVGPEPQEDEEAAPYYGPFTAEEIEGQ